MAALPSVPQAKALVAEICRNFYGQGWVSGTGGGMSIKARGEDGADRLVMAPSGVQKERMQPGHMFVLDAAGSVLEQPPPAEGGSKPLKLSECSPLFMAAYELRGAGAVLHSHSVHAVAATVLQGEAAPAFTATQLEMIKGIEGHGYYDDCVVPIIENTAREAELTGRLREAIEQYPQARAVLVRRHGIYVWGKDWVQCKTQAECYHYLFEAAARLSQLGVDVSRPPPKAQSSSAAAPAAAALPNGVPNGHAAPQGAGPNKKRKADAISSAGPQGVVESPGTVRMVVLDIEGTIAPLSFTRELLFPFARKHLRRHLQETWDTDATRAARKILLQEHAAGSLPDTPQALGDLAESLMQADVKSTGLKLLQGDIWQAGFASGELQMEVFPDVPRALETWKGAGLRIAVYSSGSVRAQLDALSHTSQGNLLPYVSTLLDTTSGPKLEASSYEKIQLTLAVRDPQSDTLALQEILFASDNPKELDAASKAGWQVLLVQRPGNDPLPPDVPHPLLSDFSGLPVPLGS